MSDQFDEGVAKWLEGRPHRREEKTYEDANHDRGQNLKVQLPVPRLAMFVADGHIPPPFERVGADRLRVGLSKISTHIDNSLGPA